MLKEAEALELGGGAGGREAVRQEMAAQAAAEEFWNTVCPPAERPAGWARLTPGRLRALAVCVAALLVMALALPNLNVGLRLFVYAALAAGAFLLVCSVIKSFTWKGELERERAFWLKNFRLVAQGRTRLLYRKDEGIAELMMVEHHMLGGVCVEGHTSLVTMKVEDVPRLEELLRRHGAGSLDAAPRGRLHAALPGRLDT